jgi:YHS domain-containing protein
MWPSCQYRKHRNINKESGNNMKQLFMILSVASLVFTFSHISFAGSCGCGCSGQGSLPEVTKVAGVQEKDSDAVQGTTTGAINVGNRTCPISGEKIDAAKIKPATVEFEGKVYNLCCAGCLDEFNKVPRKYIQKVEQEGCSAFSCEADK